MAQRARGCYTPANTEALALKVGLAHLLSFRGPASRPDLQRPRPQGQIPMKSEFLIAITQLTA